MIVLIPNINLLNLSWIIKYLFLRTVKPLTVFTYYVSKDLILANTRRISLQCMQWYLE